MSEENRTYSTLSVPCASGEICQLLKICDTTEGNRRLIYRLATLPMEKEKPYHSIVERIEALYGVSFNVFEQEEEWEIDPYIYSGVQINGMSLEITFHYDFCTTEFVHSDFTEESERFIESLIETTFKTLVL